MSERLDASFRDPSGFVFRRGGRLLRQVNESARSDFDLLHESGLYDALVSKDLLVRHEVVDEPPAEPASAAVVIAPDVVPFVSYPFEWSPGQLRAAAEATLRIQQVAMEHGMTLRDASAYNIQFLRNRPVLIDTLSFGRFEEGHPWVAYGQFCRHFLAPLALMTYVDVRMGQLLRVHIDGIPLDLASRLLPRRTRYKFGLGVHLHAHAASQRKYAGTNPAGGGRALQVSEKALQGLVDSLLSLVRKLTWEAPPSAWRDYYAARESYSETSLAHKTELVKDFLALAPAEVVWDLGANTGHFSRMAAEITGADVVALEMDPSAVQISWQELTQEGVSSVLPVWSDLSNPTPAQGWAHHERDSLADRGPADVALALALVHHLAIGNNVPLGSVLQWFAQITRRLVVEWIPKEDPMVQRMLSSREDVFTDYSTEGFERACAAHFRVLRQEAVKGSERVLYLLERR
jgi:precorrin-6B methylase 2